jgi:hypothetical protein
MITIYYHCKACGLVKRPVEVPARPSEQDLKEWMEIVKQRVADDHTMKSLTCESRHCDLLIPVPPAGGEKTWIGMQV